MLQEIINFLTNKVHSVSFKISLTFFAFLLIIFCDNLTGFSYFMFTTNKIKNITEIENIIKNTNDTTLIKNLKILETEIYYKQNIYSFLTSFLVGIQTLTITDIINQNTPTRTKNSIIREFNYLHIFTSSWGWFVLMLITPIPVIKESINLINAIFGVISAILMFTFLIFINSYIFGLIPVILKMPLINYIINILLHGLILFFSGKQILNKKIA
jgi:hypothetical protein